MASMRVAAAAWLALVFEDVETFVWVIGLVMTKYNERAVKLTRKEAGNQAVNSIPISRGN